MASVKYAIIKNLYRLKRITVADVWKFADGGEITEKEAITICGARPTE